MTQGRVARINAFLHRKLIPQELYHRGDYELHEYRRQIEGGKTPHPFDAAAARRARMSAEERAAYDEQMYREAIDVWKSLRR